MIEDDGSKAYTFIRDSFKLHRETMWVVNCIDCSERLTFAEPYGVDKQSHHWHIAIQFLAAVGWMPRGSGRWESNYRCPKCHSAGRHKDCHE